MSNELLELLKPNNTRSRMIPICGSEDTFLNGLLEKFF